MAGWGDMTAMNTRGRSRFLRKEFPGGTLLLHYKPRRNSLLRCVRVAELLSEECLHLCAAQDKTYSTDGSDTA